jgi:hypothetical protein
MHFMVFAGTFDSAVVCRFLASALLHSGPGQGGGVALIGLGAGPRLLSLLRACSSA